MIAVNKEIVNTLKMSYLVINGGKKLKGSITNQSAKNSAMAILCACLMIKGKTVLEDVPQIEEINRMIELLSSIGVKIQRKGHTVIIDAGNKLQIDKMDQKAASLMRSGLLLWGALANREKKYRLYKSGGCRLGERTVRPHIYALKELGVNIKSLANYYEVEKTVLKGSEIVMYESGDTATENVIMAAVLAKGKTIIKMASANYMVQDLCHFLNKAGAKIEGIGTTTLNIQGVVKLKTIKNYSIMPDPIVAMTFISSAITTKSTLTIKKCPLQFLELELLKLEKMGQRFEIVKKYTSKNGKFVLADIKIMPSKLKALPDKIYGRPFPGLNVDNLPLFIPILTQAKGRTLVHDWAYENRSVYYLELQKLGANITLLDPHRVWVEGETKLQGNELVCPPALRAGALVLIAMLAAKGKSILRNTYPIDRGYENLYDVLNKAGADIKIME